MSYASSRSAVEETGIFGPVMGLVAATVGFLTLGAYLGRNLPGGAAVVFFLLGFGCVVGLNFARNAGGAAIGLLFATGLFLGLGLGGVIDAYAQAAPGAVWQAAAATTLFVGGLGALGYTIEADLSAGYRVLSFLLLGLIVLSLITLFVSMPAGNVIYAVAGLAVFGGYTLLDFNRMRRAGVDDAVNLAAGIFLDVINVFTFFLQLFGNGRGD